MEPLYGCKDHVEQFLLEKRAEALGVELFLLLEESVPQLSDDLKSRAEEIIKNIRGVNDPA